MANTMGYIARGVGHMIGLFFRNL